jgi:hypothetical protein
MSAIGLARALGMILNGSINFTIPVQPPTISSVLNARGNPVGDTAGGYTVTITGTNLSNTSAITFGSNSATSINVVSSTSVTCTIPAGSGTGQVNVSLTTPGGTITNTNAWRYWDPSAKSVTGWWRENYTVSGGSTLSHWTDKSGNGRDYVSGGGAAITVSSNLNGQVTYTYQNGSQGNGAAISALLGTTASTMFIVMRPTQVAATKIIQQDGSAWAENHQAATQADASYFSAAYHTATTTNPSGTQFANNTGAVYEARVDSGTLYCVLNADTAHQGSTAFTGLGGSSTSEVGRTYVGDLAEMLTDTTAWSATDRGYFYDYAATRYALSI